MGMLKKFKEWFRDTFLVDELEDYKPKVCRTCGQEIDIGVESECKECVKARNILDVALPNGRVSK